MLLVSHGYALAIPLHISSDLGGRREAAKPYFTPQHQDQRAGAGASAAPLYPAGLAASPTAPEATPPTQCQGRRRSSRGQANCTACRDTEHSEVFGSLWKSIFNEKLFICHI